MPSTFVLQDKEDPDSSHGSEGTQASENRGDRQSAFVDLSPNKLSSMKTFGDRIKAETRKLIRYPGKALKRSSSPSKENLEERVDEEVHEDFTSFFKEHDILMEFKYVCKNPPSGVYIIPSIKSIQVWHGIIFVRAGPFKEGIFRFDVLLPDNFPCCAPLVRFTSRIFHPQIHANGILNLEQAFPCWKEGENHIIDVLKYVKSCFYNLNTWHALNEEAVTCLNDNLDEFRIKACECVKESLRAFEEESVVTAEDDGNLLKSRTIAVPLVNEWKEKLLYQDSSVSQ